MVNNSVSEMSLTKIPSLVYRLGQYSLDAFISASAISLAFLIRFEGQVPEEFQTLFTWLPLIAIVGRLAIQQFFNVYKQVWRLFSLKNTITLVQATALYSLLLLVIIRIVLPKLAINFTLPLGVAFIDWSLCLAGMVIIRYIRRRRFATRHARFLDISQAKRVLVAGAGEAGAQIVREILQNSGFEYAVVGFLDDDFTKIGRQVEGLPVLGRIDQLVAIAQDTEVKDILIAMPSAPPERIQRIVEKAEGTGLHFKILPSTTELLRDRSLTPQIRDIQIQDLLGRSEVQLEFAEQFSASLPSAAQQIQGRTVLVTGAGGTIGSEICRQILRLNPGQLILLGRGENSIFFVERELSAKYPDTAITPVIADIRHQERMHRIFEQWRPQFVFHAAAHKHVPLMEQNPTEALENNSLASLYLARLAAQFKVNTFVQISTDKAVEPCNFMGLSKRLAELMVAAVAQESATRFLVVRFGNVLGSRGSVVPIFRKQIEQGGPVTVTDAAITRYFMTVPEASQLVVQSLAIGESGQMLILDMGQPVRIYDLALQMIQLAGLRPNLDIQIQVTGLRPGEKLHESLTNQHESLVPTLHPKLSVIRNASPLAGQLDLVTSRLQLALQSQLNAPELWNLAIDCVKNLSGQREILHPRQPSSLPLRRNKFSSL